MSSRFETFEVWKPKCKGCIYRGTTLPCEYIIITGKSPQSQGAHIDPEGPGGCELYTRGKRICQNPAISYSEKKPKFNISKLDDPRVFEMYKNGATDQEIADVAGVSKWTVRDWREKKHLVVNDGRRAKAKIDEKKAGELHQAGKVDREIAEQLGVNISSVAAWRRRRGLEANRTHNARRKAVNGK